jgi:alanine racemase
LSDLAAIRDVGVSLPALLYPSTVPSQLGAVLATGAICTIHDDSALDVISVAGTAVRAFVKVDCGFGRLGFVPSSWTSIFERIAATPAIQMAGIYTHVDAPDDAAAAADQYRAFTSACEIAEQAGLRGFERMVASSRVMLAHPGLCLTAVNPGRMLYGLLEMPWTERFRAHPVVRSARARILQVKDHEPTSKIGYGAHAAGQRLRTAVVSSGFADGFGHLNVTGDVLIEGRRAPIIGRRGFEHTVVDITDIPHASVGTEVVLFGKSGTDEISQAELSRAHSLPLLELMSRIARSMPRRYLH